MWKLKKSVVNGLRAVQCCVLWLGLNGTETVHYGIRADEMSTGY